MSFMWKTDPFGFYKSQFDTNKEGIATSETGKWKENKIKSQYQETSFPVTFGKSEQEANKDEN